MPITERSRNSEQLILQKVKAMKQYNLAEAMDVSESTVSRLVGEQLGQIIDFISALDLVVVNKEDIYMEPERHRATTYFAKVGVGCTCESTDLTKP